ncbi:MAG: hypothetical protein A3K75_04460 [Euryarchaeota archaeon RBG_13_61_15]|nr:MAG: hypothetical protein A3K75_04460 [Euryarchaeota archaeon RBG_13_61_15]
MCSPGRGISLMNRRDHVKGEKHTDKSKLSLIVLTGITLFVVGFIVTISSLSGLGSSASTSDSDQTLYMEGADDGRADSTALLIGLVFSLAGVVAATAGPAAFFIHRKNRSS